MSSSEETLATIERSLTDQEQQLAYTVFGTSIEYSNVKVFKKKYWIGHPESENTSTIMTPDGNLYAPGKAYVSDYSQARPTVRGWFIHEMTHVWQHKNGMNLVAHGMATFIKKFGYYDNAYFYELSDPSPDLATYGFEQQASIVEEYFLSRNNFTPEEWKLKRNEFVGTNVTIAEMVPIYAQGVLKNFLRDPAYQRSEAGLALNSPGVAISGALLSSNPSIYRSRSTQLGYLRTGDRVIVVDMGADRPFNKTETRWQWCEVEVKSGQLNGQKGWVMKTLVSRFGM